MGFPSWKKYKYIILTMGLIFFLLIPYILRIKSNKLEIFPSVVIPTGAHLVHKKDIITFGSYELYAKKNGSVERLETKKFLNPIPEWYVNHIAKSNFGLDSFSEEVTLSNKLSIKFINYNRFSPSEIERTRIFYQERLKSLGFDDSVLIYRDYKVQFHDSVQNKILISEKIYNLK